MHLSSCLYPKVLKNRYTGEMVSCRCNKCSACLNARAKDWINRLDLEMQVNKFCYMVNLTYDNDHVPRLGFDETMENLTFINRRLDWCIPVSDLVGFCRDDNEVELLRDRLIHPLGLPVCCPDDISRFFKRFNKYCFKHVTFKFENFRYFCAHELGPTTFRPHAHILVFFNDRLIANRFQEILSSCWSFGDSRAESVYSRGGRNYVAQYVNMSSHLPAFFTHHRLRPRPQFSKSPCIGSVQLLDEDLRELYDRLPLYRNVWVDGSKKYLDLPMPSSFNNRFFPKCPRYSELTDHDRIVLYGVTDWFDTEGSFEGFYKNVKVLRELRSRSVSRKCSRYKVLTDYCDFVMSFSLYEKTLINSLKRLYALSLRVCWFAKRLGVSVDWLVGRIIEYWKKVDYEHLCDQYRYQENFVKQYPLQELVHMYPLFKKNLPKTDLMSDFYRLALSSFGFKDSSSVKDLKDTQFWKALRFQSDGIYKDTHKRHEVNRYLYSKKLGVLDPSLQKILIKYHSRKKLYETKS